MSYSPNIPQPGDNPSQSQGLMLTNFQQLNIVYGHDHYPYTNGNPAEAGKHAFVTLPALPSADPPGNALPAPAAGNIAEFAQTVNSITSPYWRRDGLATNIPLMPIKAFGTISSAGLVVGTAYNLTSAFVSPGVTTISLTANVVSGLNVMILVSIESSGSDAIEYNTKAYSGGGVLSFKVRTFNSTNNAAFAAPFSVAVLEFA